MFEGEGEEVEVVVVVEVEVEEGVELVQGVVESSEDEANEAASSSSSGKMNDGELMAQSNRCIFLFPKTDQKKKRKK